MRTWARTLRSVLAGASVLALVAMAAACATPATPGSGASSEGGSTGSTGSSEPASTPPSSSSGTGATASGTGRGGASELDGTSFTSTEISGGQTLVEGSEVTLTFEDGNVSMNAGCNTYFGSVDASGGTLSAPQLAGTMMACDESLMSQDEWLVAFLASGPTWTYADGTLELTDGTDTLTFSDTPPDRTADLTSTGWRVTDLISNTSTASSVSAVSPEVEAWIRILPNGEVGLNTGCNGGGGSVQISPTDLTWDSIITTLIACEGPADETERVMLAVLKDTTPYEIATSPSGPVLTIMSADGGSGLMFVADPSAGADMAVEAPADSATSSAEATTG